MQLFNNFIRPSLLVAENTYVLIILFRNGSTTFFPFKVCRHKPLTFDFLFTLAMSRGDLKLSQIIVGKILAASQRVSNVSNNFFLSRKTFLATYICTYIYTYVHSWANGLKENLLQRQET